MEDGDPRFAILDLRSWKPSCAHFLACREILFCPSNRSFSAVDKVRLIRHVLCQCCRWPVYESGHRFWSYPIDFANFVRVVGQNC